jgi:GH25 family lysozyme M1 (1,4-beta-N-acetylmuramidase)
MDRKIKILLVGIGILILGILLGIVYFIYSNYFKIDIDNTNIVYKDNLDVEVYSEVFVSDLIDRINGEIIEDKLIDTDILGNRDISFLYLDSNDKKKLGYVSINVIDSTSPLIFLSSSYTIKLGSDEILTDSIMSVDNYDNNPNREIIGSYDSNIEGEYPLIYKVTDSSGNVSSKDFVLKVVDTSKNNNKDTNNSSYTDFNQIVKKYKDENNYIGIDISKWQGDIDFSKIKSSGVEFVMIKIGGQDEIDGESIMDPYFEDNIKMAYENGLMVGIYYYSCASSVKDAVKQADWVSKKLSKYDIDLPVVFDWENWSNFNTFNVSLYDINQIADTFLNVLEKNGYSSMLYGSKYYLENIWEVYNKNIWLAHYTNKTDYNNSYKMWQICSDGKIDGINTYVDIDILYLST